MFLLLAEGTQTALIFVAGAEDSEDFDASVELFEWKMRLGITCLQVRFDSAIVALA